MPTPDIIADMAILYRVLLPLSEQSTAHSHESVPAVINFILLEFPNHLIR